jgi:hypothetical protein
VVIEEQFTHDPMLALRNKIDEVLLHRRNRESLLRLADVVERRRSALAVSSRSTRRATPAGSHRGSHTDRCRLVGRSLLGRGLSRNGVTRPVEDYLPGCGESAFDGHLEGVVRWLPAHRPAFAALAGRVEAHVGEDTLSAAGFVREGSAGLDCPADASVHALDRVR